MKRKFFNLMGLLGGLITSVGLGLYGVSIGSLLIIIPMFIASLIFLFGLITTAIISENLQP